MVHSVRPVLAHRIVRIGDLSLGLAVDSAIAYFWHRSSWSFELDQRAVFSTSQAASRAASDLTRSALQVDYFRVN